jgi:hypothetical protein
MAAGVPHAGHSERKMTGSRFSKACLIAGTLVCFAFLGFAITRHAMVPNTFAKVAIYGVPLVAGILLLAATRLPAPHRMSLVITLVAAMASLYGVEIFLASRPRVIAPRPPGAVPATDAQVVRVLNAWARRGAAAGGFGLRVEVNGDTVLPLAPGVADTPTLLCTYNGRPLMYHSDARGFNNGPNAWQSTPFIAAIGDSFTQGICVPAEQTFVGRLRTRWPQTLNLGVSGSGPLFQLAILREYVADVRPSIVLWFYYEGNDLGDLAAEWELPILRRYLVEGYRQRLPEHQADVDRELRPLVARQPTVPVDAASKRLEIAKLTHVRTAIGLPRRGIRFSRFAEFRPRLDSVLRAAQKSVQAWNGSLYFVYLPTQARFERRPYATSSFHDRDAVLSLVQSLGIPVIDVAEPFRAHPAPESLWPYPGAHYGPEGNRVTAEAVIAALARVDAVAPVPATASR